MLSTMAPFMASELLEQLCGKQLPDCTWPAYDPAMLVRDTATLVVQVNGKLRADMTIKRGAAQEDVEARAMELVLKWLDGKTPVKVIYVQDKLINFVIK
jgi:leucyl-tRNA synthetase